MGLPEYERGDVFDLIITLQLKIIPIKIAYKLLLKEKTTILFLCVNKNLINNFKQIKVFINLDL